MIMLEDKDESYTPQNKKTVHGDSNLLHFCDNQINKYHVINNGHQGCSQDSAESLKLEFKKILTYSNSVLIQFYILNQYVQNL